MSVDPTRPWQASYPEGLAVDIAPVAFDSIPDLFAATVAEYGDRPAFSNLGVELSFTELGRHVDALAAYLQGELGLVKGDRIVLQMPNLLQYPVAVFAALKAGLIVVNANPLYTPHEMLKVFTDSGAVAIIILENFADKLEEVLPQTAIKHIILTQVGDLLPALKRGVVNFTVKRINKLLPEHGLTDTVRLREALRVGRGLSVTPPAIDGDDLAFLQYTGGTTGGTKAAMLSHLNLISNQYQMMGQMRIALGDAPVTVIAALPLYHVFCLTVNCLGFFQFGAHNVLITNPRDTAGMVKTIRKTRPRVLILVSTLAAALLDNPDFARLDFSTVRLSVAGGMALRRSVAERWREVTGNPLLEGYGLTEASPVVAVNPTMGEPRIGTIGLPLPSTDVQIRADDGTVQPVGERGELMIKGPQVMQGYWNQPEESAIALDADGWLHTGDIATMDADGYFTIVDRKKDLIVVSGFNVYPGEVEEAASSNPKVADAGVVGVPDEHSGEAVTLFVVKRDPSLTEQELRDYLKTYLVAYKRPRKIIFRDELPKSNVGKVLRRKLLADVD